MRNKKLPPLKSLGVTRVTEAAGIVEYRLANGLKILLKENHAAPVTTFMVAYPVGSRNEGAGNTGSAHFFEHLMFKGTRQFDPEEGNGVMDVFARVGAFINANTSRDRTRYFEVVPSEHLELTIRVEADRMRGLKNRKRDRNSEMTVVRNEFERGENSPGSALYKEVCAAAFKEHPYHHSVIGFRSDVEGIPMKRMVEFYDQYYWPNNATAIVVGDFASDEALRLIAKYFGRIPRSPQAIPQVYTVEPPQEGEKRLEVRRSGDLPQLLIAYHTQAASHPDTYTLAVLHAILGNSGKASSPLYKALVKPGLVTSASAGNDENRDPGLFMISATLTPGTEFALVEAAIYAELSKLASEPVSLEDLGRVKAANRKGTVLANDDPKNLTDLISQGESVADWKWAVEYDDHVDAVTPEDIMRVAGTYFNARNRTVGHFIPTDPEPGQAATASPASQATPVRARGNQRRPQGKRRVKLNAQSKSSASFASQVVKEVLPNGLTVLVLPNRGTGSVAVNGAIFAGDSFGNAEKHLVPGMTASMMTSGSAGYSKVELGKILEEMGAGLRFSTDDFKSSFAALIDANDFGNLVKVLSDVMVKPLFPEEELVQTKRQYRASLVQRLKNTGSRANNALFQAIYGEGHPFHAVPYEASIAELDVIGCDDLRSFHAEHYSPKSTILTVVGDVDPSSAIALIKEHFGQWSGPDRKAIVVQEAALPASASRIEIPLADKANVDIVIGHPTPLARTSADYFAAAIANSALGASTIADRLGKVIRVKHGLTYGVNSSFGDSSFGATPWTVSLSVNPVNVEKALALVDEVLREYLTNGITPEELEDKIGQSIGSFVVRLRSSAGIAQTLCHFEFTGLTAAAMDSLPDGFRAVTKADVDAAIRKYFQPSHAVTALAGTFAA